MCCSQHQFTAIYLQPKKGREKQQQAQHTREFDLLNAINDAFVKNNSHSPQVHPPVPFSPHSRAFLIRKMFNLRHSCVY